MGLPGTSWVPTLTTDEVAAAGPREAVLTIGTVGVGGGGTVVSPPGVVVAVAPAGRAWGTSALHEGGARSSKDSCEGREGNKDGGEGDHVD